MLAETAMLMATATVTALLMSLVSVSLLGIAQVYLYRDRGNYIVAMYRGVTYLEIRKWSRAFASISLILWTTITVAMILLILFS